jgi:hypothetical protein
VRVRAKGRVMFMICDKVRGKARVRGRTIVWVMVKVMIRAKVWAVFRICVKGRV